MENLTVVIPFWNGYHTIERLLDSLPPGLPVIIVDDHSDRPLQLKRPGVRVLWNPQKGYFSGAVNTGLAACSTDALVLNQDVWFKSNEWLVELEKQRKRYAFAGDGVLKHPAWPKGYIHGTFMFMRRDAIEAVGGLNVEEYPLWGSTCEWQLRACRAGFQAKPSQTWRRWMGHEGRHDGHQKLGRRQKYGEAIRQAMEREPQKRHLFLRTPPAISVIVPCYNYGRYLQDAINSLLGGPTSLGHMAPQTFQSFEVIIVDDASTDNSWEIIKTVADTWKGIHAIRLAKNRGTPGAINAGIASAHGEFIHILSADDMRESWGLETLYRAVKKNRKAVAYGDIRIFADGQRGRVLKLPSYDFDLVLHKNPMPAGILYSRHAWQKVGGYPEVMRFGREDWAFNIALGAAGFCGEHVGMSGNLYRREKQNRSLRTGNVHRGEEGGGFSWRQTFKQQLQALYPELYSGDRPMGCCGDRKKTKPTAAQSRALATAPAPEMAMVDGGNGGGLVEGMELLEYIGGNDARSPWYGDVTRTRYYFGGQQTVRQVYAEDVPAFLNVRKHRKPQFRRFRGGQPRIPLAQAQVANPPEPVAPVAPVAPAEQIPVEPQKSPDLIITIDPSNGIDQAEASAAAKVLAQHKAETTPDIEIQIDTRDEAAPEVDSTPKAAELAESLGLDLLNIEGTGAGGRILVRDVRNYAAALA